jgi:hypothetical protein
MGLAELDLVLDQLRRVHHDEQRLAVDLELGPLMRLERILDREIMQAEALLHLAEDVLARLMQADPDEPPGLGLELGEAVDVEISDPPSLLISRTADDHGHGASIPACQPVPRA